MRRVVLGTGSTRTCQLHHVRVRSSCAIAIETKTHLTSRTEQTPNTTVGSEWKQTFEASRVMRLWGGPRAPRDWLEASKSG